MHDVLQMYLYPALDYSIFDRSGLQRTFASLRRFLYIPEATDMYLSSFDTYWVNWYVELCQRLGVEDELHKVHLPCDDPSDRGFYKLFCQLVGKVHRACGEYPKGTVGRDRFFADASKKAIKEVCRGQDCANYAQCARKIEPTLSELMPKVYNSAMWGEKGAGLLHPIEEKGLRLFGERKSPLIKTLNERYKFGEKRLAVPYNANISFLVYRKDLLQQLRGGISSDDFGKKVTSVFEDLEKASKDAGFKSTGSDDVTLGVDSLVKTFENSAEYVPETWEEIVALCELGSDLLGRRLQFLVETRTFDTFACTLLEVVWSTGKDIKVFPDYSFTEADDEVCKILFRAYYLLCRMFEKDIIPRNSCLEPAEFAAQSLTARSEWLFARHWYSTLVDVLTARHRRRNAEGELVWKPDAAVRIETMPIPLFLPAYEAQLRATKTAQGKKADKASDHEVTHRACWGEWYLGIVRGTENETLSVDLINNLMSSRKVCERAFSGAALPTVEEFYEMYGNARCFNLPDRPHKLLPDKTYKEMKKMFADARTRTDIFDFRHCMRELHSVLEYVRVSERISAHELRKAIDNAILRIKDLGNKQVLVSWPFQGGQKPPVKQRNQKPQKRKSMEDEN